MPPLENRNEERGLTPLRSLVPKIEPLPSNSAFRQTGSGSNSEITGSESRALAASNSTGMRHGGTTAVALPSGLQATLNGADAWATDKALIASLPLPVRSRLKSKVNHDFDLMGYELSGVVDADLAAEAHAVVCQSCVPADRAVILAEVTKCFAVTAARDHDETDMKATLAGMVDGLREFPADVIRDACRAYAKGNKWRPSLSELREYCWPRFRTRESLRAALRRAA